MYSNEKALALSNQNTFSFPFHKHTLKIIYSDQKIKDISSYKKNSKHGSNG